MGDQDIAVVADYLRVVMKLRALEPAFVEAARRYSSANGISRAAWLEFGVAPAVLDAAGVHDGRALRVVD